MHQTQERPTAIFAQNDKRAGGPVRYAWTMGKLLRWFWVLLAVGSALCETAKAEVGQRTLALQDPARQRSVVTEVWYPTADRPGPRDHEQRGPYVTEVTVRDAQPGGAVYPLVLLSHGTGGNRLTMAWLATGLVHRGYIVAAVDHWGNTHDNAIPEYFLKAWERPQDLSFALTELLRHPDFGPHIAPEAVGAIGFSLGGYTVLALAGGAMDLNALYQYSDTADGRREAEIPELPQLARLMHDPTLKTRLFADFEQSPPLRDRRIKAIIALAPAIGQAFTRAEQFPEDPPPVLIVGAGADHLAPVATNAAHYHKLIPGSRLVTLPAPVGHFVFLNEAHEHLRDQLPGLFLDDPAVNRRQIHADTIRLAVDFFAEHFESR